MQNSTIEKLSIKVKINTKDVQKEKQTKIILSIFIYHILQETLHTRHVQNMLFDYTIQQLPY